VAYRKQHPDEETNDRVLKELKDNIKVSQLEDWPVDHCQQPESSTEGRRSDERHRCRE